MVHICEVVMTAGVFSFFQNFDIPGCCRGKGQIIVQNDKKLLHFIDQEPVYYMIVIYGALV